MNRLVQRLSEGNHAVTVGGPKPTLEDLKKRVTDMHYAFIKFVDTQGGTDLGVHLDTEATNLSQANFEQGIGVIHIEGTLTLNDVKVLCIADIDLETLNGTGHLVALKDVYL